MRLVVRLGRRLVVWMGKNSAVATVEQLGFSKAKRWVEPSVGGLESQMVELLELTRVGQMVPQ